MTEKWFDCDYLVSYKTWNNKKEDIYVNLCLRTEDEDGCDYCKQEECNETEIGGIIDDG